MNDITHPYAFIAIVLVLIILLIICYIKSIRDNKQIPNDARCQNCKTKTYEDMMDIRCKNKKSKKYGTMVDDYAVCECWKGERECKK
jgi:hypothetical protein